MKKTLPNLPDRLDPRAQEWMRAPELAAVLDAVEKAGGQARIVGGAVRDALLGRAVGEVDLAGTLPPEKTIQALEKAGLKAVPTGIEHGTVTAVSGGRGFEITTLRRDIETDGRRAKVAFTDDWAADAARRDFTFNALYLDKTGRIDDFTGGLADLAARRVRFIGDPDARLREDVLRLLRYFRFLAQMRAKGDPLAPDPAALAACRRATPALGTLSAERVGREISRLLLAADPAPVLNLMQSEGVLSHILPEISRIDRLAALVRAERAYRISPAFVRRLAALLAPGAATAAKRLRLSKVEAKRLAELGKLPQTLASVRGAKALRQRLYDHGAGAVRDALLLLIAQGQKAKAALLPEVDRWQKPVFPLNGKDLIAHGLKSGPALGKKLAEIESWWRAQDFKPSRADCLKKLSNIKT